MPTYAPGLFAVDGFRTYRVTADELAPYQHATEPAEDGYLVTYMCDVGTFSQYYYKTTGV